MKTRARTVKAPETQPTQHRNWWLAEGPTPGQIRQFFAQVPSDDTPRGINTFARLQKYLHGVPFVTDELDPAAAQETKLTDVDATRVAEIVDYETRLAKAAMEHFPDNAYHIVSLATFARQFKMVPFAALPEHQDDGHVVRMAKGALPWITVSNVKVQRISMQHPVCHDKSMWARWDDLMLGPYHEQIALHHRLNGSLKSGVDELHVASHRLFHNEDYGNTAAYRYGLINENRKVAMGNLYCELVHQALTLAAIGDPVRLTVLKGALQLFFEGFPPAGYDGETVTVLCNPF